MGPRLRAAFEVEFEAAEAAANGQDLGKAWRHLERAHILGQAFAGPHIRVHVRMLCLGWRQRNVREVVGQFARITLAGPGSLLGRAPSGNPGSASVGIFTRVPVPADLRRWLAADADR